MISETDQRFMALALTLGQRNQGRTWPNPAVGCVLVRDGRIVGRGWTQEGGRPHAEPMALAQAGTLAKGATAYVTLEPCAHFGKTGPCANALSEAGIARCVVACLDPDTRVAGRGVDIMTAAGITVDIGCLEGAANITHRGFFKRIRVGRPRVTLKLAMSIDGRIATHAGHSQWITGPVSRRYVHMMRLCHDGVMVGGGTARDDDPSLTARDMGDVRQPVRIIASAQAKFEGEALRETAQAAPLWICHSDKVDVSEHWGGHATLMPTPADADGRLDPTSLMQNLGDAGLTSVLCEGGGQLGASLIKADLVDDLVIFGGGIAIGADGRPGLGMLGLDRLDEAMRFELIKHSQIGGDIMHHWRSVLTP